MPRRATTRSCSPPVRLSVIVPACQEERRIARAITEIRRELDDIAAHGGLEIIVVDDGSTDATAREATAAGADQVVQHETNRGKGAAIRTGVFSANGRTIAFTDADLSYPPAQLAGLVREVERGSDIVVGSRRHVDTTTLLRARRLRELSGRVFSALTRVVLRGSYEDTQCGLKAFRADVARLVFSRGRIDRFAFDVEVLHIAERHGVPVKEMPVTVVNRTTSSVRIVKDSLGMFVDLIRIRLWSGRGAYDPGHLTSVGGEVRASGA